MSAIISGNSPSVTFSDGTTQSTAFTATPALTSVTTTGGANFATSSGNVGVGTASPAYKLDVVGDSRITASSNTNGLALTSAFDNTALVVSSTSTGGATWKVMSTAGGSGYGQGSLAFEKDASLKMLLDSSGNLLVGTTSIIGSGSCVRKDANGYVFAVSNQISGAAQTFRSAMATTASTTTSYHFVGNCNGAGDRIYIYGNGNIVNTNNSYGALSDIAIKENIVDTSPKLDDLLQVKVRNYNLIADESKTKQIGVVAQELEQVFPSMVEVDGMSGHKQVKYSVFVPMLIKAVQELNAKVEALEAQLGAK